MSANPNYDILFNRIPEDKIARWAVAKTQNGSLIRIPVTAEGFIEGAPYDIAKCEELKGDPLDYPTIYEAMQEELQR